MSEQQPAGAPRALRLFALVAVCVGVAALAVAAFIYSYTGIHAVALQAGVNSRLAKGYPLILDVLLVVILAALLALRGGGWPSKLLAWVSLFALLAAAAGADAMHAAGDRLPVRAAEITAAVLPWALVLIAFVLLLAMLRQAKVRRQAQTNKQVWPPKWQALQPPPLPRQALVPGFPAAEEPAARLPAAQLPAAETPAADTPAAPAPVPTVPAAQAPAAKPNDTLRMVVPRQVAPEIEADGAATEPAMAAVAPDGALDAELAPDDPSSDEAAPAPADDDAEAEEAPPAAAASEKLETDQDEADTAESDPVHSDTAASDHVDSDPGQPDTGDRDTGDPDMGGPETGDPATGDPETGDPEAGDPEAGDPDSDEVIQTADTEMPVFHRMWSSPAPPSEDAG